MWPFSSRTNNNEDKPTLSTSDLTNDTSRNPTSCPIDHQGKHSQTTDKGRCPVDHAREKKAAAEAARDMSNSSSGCPVDHETRAAYLAQHQGEASSLDPRNQMPQFSQEPASDQTVDLSTERTISSIPRGDSPERWEYPSPQQFYHALRRKGKDAPEEHINVMLDIHNFLNEACWEQVLYWESLHADEHCEPSLVKFTGRPTSLSPKARFFSWFGSPEPFDRHDWTVDRCGRPIRYVLDYYMAPPDEEGNPVFNVDVRPALDSFESVWDRIRMNMREFRDSWQSTSNTSTSSSSTATGVERPEAV
ncbi:cytochrome c/c1 heme lyase-domain-containing protein [Syncephalis plumigaleata]|nr:cytochrome c/c1 heme lyase-domain-containing protein [Syncephalis plumigaleata]